MKWKNQKATTKIWDFEKKELNNKIEKMKKTREK
jgi:hypothetical protein